MPPETKALVLRKYAMAFLSGWDLGLAWRLSHEEGIAHKVSSTWAFEAVTAVDSTYTTSAVSLQNNTEKTIRKQFVIVVMIINIYAYIC